MRARALVGPALLLLLSVCSFRPAIADVQDYPVYVPADWAGLWADADTTRDCNTHQIVGTYTATDTLCEGAVLPVIFYGSDFSGSHPLYWAGTANSTTISVTTYFSRRVAMGIYYTMSYFMTEVRTGDMATRTITISGAYDNPPSPPDFCQTRTGILMRIAPPAITCSPVSVRKSTWGSLKLRYR